MWTDLILGRTRHARLLIMGRGPAASHPSVQRHAASRDGGLLSRACHAVTGHGAGAGLYCGCCGLVCSGHHGGGGGVWRVRGAAANCGTMVFSRSVAGPGRGSQHQHDTGLRTPTPSVEDTATATTATALDSVRRLQSGGGEPCKRVATVCVVLGSVGTPRHSWRSPASGSMM